MNFIKVKKKEVKSKKKEKKYALKKWKTIKENKSSIYISGVKRSILSLLYAKNIRKSGSPIKLGMTIYYGSSIKDFEDDSGCAFGDDSSCAFVDESVRAFEDVRDCGFSVKLRMTKKKNGFPLSREWQPRSSWERVFIFLLRENLFFIILIKIWPGSPIELGMTSYYGSSIKDFEDDSGCAFEDDSGCAFEDDSYYGFLQSLGII